MLKESRYVRLANTMYRILRNSRIPLFLHRKSNHVFTVWRQHLVLLTIRQYEGKSYRICLSSGWLKPITYEHFYSCHTYTSFYNIAKERGQSNSMLLEKIISSFIILT